MNNFIKRSKSLLKLDFKRMFTMPFIYIMIGVSFLMPILILVMTTMVSTEETDAASMFYNTWQAIGSLSGSNQTSMDLTGMCNINMLYFLVIVVVAVFVGSEFRCGYVKNLFTTRGKKTNYILSKTIVLFSASSLMFIAYFIGSIIGGAISGLSFEMIGFNACNLVLCLLAKIFIILIFVGITLLISLLAKERIWLSIIGGFAGGMLLFTMIPMITPLDTSFINLILCLVGGILFSTGLGFLSNIILKKISIL